HGFFNEDYLRQQQRLQQAWRRDWVFNPEKLTLPLGEGARNPLAYGGIVLANANTPAVAAADGGLLTGELLCLQRLHGMELAVFSACSTGLGEIAVGECVGGLQMALHLAGCRSVVAALWEVPDEATAALMAVFYDELLRNKKEPLQALRAAQL